MIHINKSYIKRILQQSNNLFNGQIKYYLKIYTFVFKCILYNQLYNHVLFIGI